MTPGERAIIKTIIAYLRSRRPAKYPGGVEESNRIGWLDAANEIERRFLPLMSTIALDDERRLRQESFEEMLWRAWNKEPSK